MTTIYKALDHNQNYITTVIASDTTRARAEVSRQLAKNRGRQPYLKSWVANDQALLDTSVNQVIDYIEIDLPDDVTDNADERATLAINQARDHSFIYAMPCQWQIIADDGNTVQIERTRKA